MQISPGNFHNYYSGILQVNNGSEQLQIPIIGEPTE